MRTCTARPVSRTCPRCECLRRCLQAWHVSEQPHSTTTDQAAPLASPSSFWERLTTQHIANQMHERKHPDGDLSNCTRPIAGPKKELLRPQHPTPEPTMSHRWPNLGRRAEALVEARQFQTDQRLRN